MMSTIEPRQLAAVELATMLRAWAEGDYAVEAAVELLITQGTWLTRGDFLVQLVDAVDDGWSHRGLVPMATIDWGRAPAFLAKTPASSGEAGVLRVAASIAGGDTGSLRKITSGLDPTNTERVLQAIAHSAGWHERNRHALVTGDLADVQAGAPHCVNRGQQAAKTGSDR